jgi:hypothetical protein
LLTLAEQKVLSIDGLAFGHSEVDAERSAVVEFVVDDA